ncbi:MAG: hypothetical protein L3J67_08040 [Hyphomicrobiaceae bacterium]|nr:hypothetical protein [Hyphomicrobiaceae bacterium]
MKKLLADAIFQNTSAASTAIDAIIEACHKDLDKTDMERIRLIKSCGKIFSEIKEIDDYLADNFPDLAKKYRPHSYGDDGNS